MYLTLSCFQRRDNPVFYQIKLNFSLVEGVEFYQVGEKWKLRICFMNKTNLMILADLNTILYFKNLVNKVLGGDSYHYAFSENDKNIENVEFCEKELVNFSFLKNPENITIVHKTYESLGIKIGESQSL